METWDPPLFIVPVEGRFIGRGILPDIPDFARQPNPHLLVILSRGLPPKILVSSLDWQLKAKAKSVCVCVCVCVRVRVRACVCVRAYDYVSVLLKLHSNNI